MTIDKWLKNTALTLIFLIPFIPLYVSNSLFFPFITGKAFAFRILVEIVFALWIVLVLRDRKYAPKFSWLSLSVTVFMLAILVADLMGVNPIRSLWSNFERMEGWVVIVHLWAYFIAVSGLFGTGEEGKVLWHRYLMTTIIAAFLVGLYGVWQLAGWAEIHQGSSRIDASLGNAAYMAVYTLFHVFIAFYMTLVERGKKRIGLSWLYALSSVFFAFILYETATRGTILGLIGGIMLSLLIYSVFGRGQPKKPRLISAGVILVIILVSGIFYLNRDSAFVQGNETLRRMASISWNETQTQARAYIWPMAVKGVFQNPKTAIVGWGQENFNYIFNANYDARMWSQEQWFDRAHSVYLDWLVAGGIIGLVLYILLFIFSLVMVWRGAGFTIAEKSVLSGLIAAYAVHNIFVFDNLASYMLFFMLLAFIHSVKAGGTVKWFAISDIQTENKIIYRDYVFSPIILIVLLLILYFVNIRPIEANTRLIAASSSCSGGSAVPSAPLYAKALLKNQYMANQEIREQLITCANNVVQSSLSPEIKSAFYQLAKKEIDNQIKITPNDARAYAIGGSFMNIVGDFESGKPLLEKAHELSLAKQSIAFELATNYMNTKMEKEAAELLRVAYEAAPDNTAAKIGYISLLILSDQEKKARELFSDEPDLFFDQRVLSVYARLKQYPKVIEGYKALVKKTPTDLNLHAELAAAYLSNKQPALAIAELKDMAVQFPLAKPQIEEAIKKIRADNNIKAP